MRSRLAWFVLGAVLAGIVLHRLLGERAARHSAAAPEPDLDPRAEELRQRLADAREASSHLAAPEPEPPVAEPGPAPRIDERRSAVHRRARTTIDTMKTATPDE